MNKIKIKEKRQSYGRPSYLQQINNTANTQIYKQMNLPYDRRWYTELGLGLNAIAVTAPVCPFKTEMGNPSGKRHYQKRGE